MSIYDLKPKFQNLLRPLTKRLFDAGISANQVTVFACVASIFIGILLIKFAHISLLFLLLPIWMFLRMALNAIDGMLAREFNQKSKLGGYLNEVTDIISDGMLYLPFAFIVPFSWAEICLIIWLATISEFIGVLGQIHGNSRRYDGPMGKSDRAFIFGLLGTIYALFGSLTEWIYYGSYIVIFLLALTCINRIKAGLKEQK